jgi:hypothetical protein
MKSRVAPISTSQIHSVSWDVALFRRSREPRKRDGTRYPGEHPSCRIGFSEFHEAQPRLPFGDNGPFMRFTGCRACRERPIRRPLRQYDRCTDRE